MAAGDIVLGANQYGKAECRLVRVTRDTPRHEIEDLTVTTQLRGDFEACHTVGDNSRVVATDTQKNTVYAYAREHGIGSPETFLLRLGRHFVDDFAWVDGGRFEARRHAWERIAVDGARPQGSGRDASTHDASSHDGSGHDHAFVRAGTETRTAVVQLDGGAAHVVAGLEGLTVLKSTGSEFHGFPRDRYTTLAETDDRVLATSVTARWRYAPGSTLGAAGDGWSAADFDEVWAGVRATLLRTFATTHSLALQQTIFAVGRAVLERFDAVAEIRLSCPNKHHFLVDLAPFGLDNPGEVFLAADRPYGLIEATVEREGAPAAPAAWAGVPGFV